MRCESCGKELPEDAAFCAECGERTPPRSAGEIADFAHTSELVRGRDEGVVPELPEPAEAADSVPEIPAGASLPAGAGAELTTEAMTATGSATGGVPEGFIEAARVREEKRRAAQALVEAAQLQLHDEREGIPQPDTMIWEQEAPAEGGHVGMGAEPPPPPPPPPPPIDARMWEGTRERAELHGVGLPTQAPEDPLQQRARRLLEADDSATDEEKSGQNCCAYGCIAFFVVMFLFLIVSAIIRMG